MMDTTTRRPLARIALTTTAIAAGLLAMPARPAGAITTTTPITARVSTAPGGGQLAMGSPLEPNVDATGRFAFFTTKQPVVAADTNGADDVYRKDRLTGGVLRVSLQGEAGQIPAGSRTCGVSTNGRFVAFQTSSADATWSNQIWRRDLVAKTTVQVTKPGSGAGGAAFAADCPISDDGARVAYQSSLPGLGCGTSGLEQVILRRFDTDTTSCLSLSSGGNIADDDSSVRAIAGSGDVVAFVSDATNLVSGDTNGTYDVFFRQLSTNATTRITLPGGVQSNGDSQSPSLSGTGRFVSFTSSATNLVPDDDNATRDVFRLDRQTGAIERVSVSSAGVEGNGYSSASTITPYGRYVAFVSEASNLYPADANGSDDIFRRDLDLDRTDLASRRWNGIAAGNSASWHTPDISSDGRVVAFESTATDLVAGDTNGQRDSFVRDFAVDLAPFGSTKAFAKQQLLDFGPPNAAPAQAGIDADALVLQAGELSPDGLITSKARGASWTVKRSPLIRLYWAFFLRAPDPSGMTYWTNQLTGGKTLAQVAAQFARSSEFKTKYGSKANEQFVTLIYQNIFERDPDPGGLAYWTGKLDAGTKTRGDVMTNFSESSEGKRFLAPQVDTVNIWLGMLRTMPSKAELTAWIVDIRSGAKVAEQVAAHLRTLPAYAGRVTK
jgi:hypothetical protein